MVVSADPLFTPTVSNNTFTGNSSANILSGYSGNDRLFGGAGDDLFHEGQHVWQVSRGGFVAGTAYDLGLGDDYFDGGTGIDLLSIGGTARDAVLDLATQSLTRGVEIDRFVNVEAFELGAGNDLLTGLRTGQFVDLGGGDDTATGIAAGVYLSGGNGTDRLDLSLSTIAVDIDERSVGRHAGSQVYGFELIQGALNATNWIRATEAADTVSGGLLDDILSGDAGNDSLLGDAGSDQLYGAVGDDTLSGARARTG